jgi:hypothetical protein
LALTRERKLIELGGYLKGITDIDYADVAMAQAALDIGEDLRHYPHYEGVYFAVVNKKHSISVTNLDIARISRNEPISLLSDNLADSDSLSSTFEVLWKQSVPAADRIQELLEGAPQQA